MNASDVCGAVAVIYAPNGGQLYPTPHVQQRTVDTVEACGGLPFSRLSARQREVLELIMRGQSNKEIARALNLGVGTVKIHVAGLFNKLGVHRRAAAAFAGSALATPPRQVARGF
jgi:DNA-binding NarL/FixJ family response regulator